MKLSPEARVRDATNAIARSYDCSVRVDARDDASGLAAAFNGMLEALESLAVGLDETVRERTAQLEAVVEELLQEIGQREKAEERIRFLAYYDALTGLPNRELLSERLERSIGEAERSGRPLALLYLDLDRFKEVNDSLGHSCGDRLLEQVAERLLGCVRVSDQVARPDSSPTVCRHGGDEFTVLINNLQGTQDATRVATRILDALQEPFQLPDGEATIGASIGIAIYPSDGGDAEALIKAADTAMYHAKAGGRNDFHYFSEQMKTEAVQRIVLEADLRQAVDGSQFALVYQPIVDLTSGRIESVEALLRWHHPERGSLSPEAFLQVAEDTGLILPIGAWVLESACRQAQAWRAQGADPLRISVNLSSRQFRKRSLQEAVDAALAASGLPADWLQLEVTESRSLREESGAVPTLAALQERGVRIALDDFGTGYGSLAQLERLPLDSLKIDRSFVAGLGHDPSREAIVRSIIDLAHALDLATVAEGVEEAVQLTLLRGMGCDRVQGFLMHDPVAGDEVPRLLQRSPF